MQTFLALYRGRSIRTARLVAVTVDPAMVHQVAQQILAEPDPTEDDPILDAMAQGEKQALVQMTQGTPLSTEARRLAEAAQALLDRLDTLMPRPLNEGDHVEREPSVRHSANGNHVLDAMRPVIESLRLSVIAMLQIKAQSPREEAPDADETP